MPDKDYSGTPLARKLGAKPGTGAAARRDTLVGQDLTQRIVHLALHAQAGRIDETRLVMSDGYLTVKDVWGLSLEGAPLVVLSACPQQWNPAANYHPSDLLARILTR